MRAWKIFLIIIVAIILTPAVEYAAKLIGVEIWCTPLVLALVLLLLAWALE